MHVISAKAVAFKEAQSESFVKYQQDIVENAKTLAGCLMDSGIKLTSDGTDNHMMLVDLRNLSLTGKKAESILGTSGITVNKNAIPFDPLGPMITSGIRIGTPAVTSRGMKQKDMMRIAELIVDVLKSPDNDRIQNQARSEVKTLCKEYPLYPDRFDGRS